MSVFQIREGRGRFETQRVHSGKEKLEWLPRMPEPLEARERQGTDSPLEPPQGTSSPDTLILDFWPQDWENKFLLFEATQFAVICYCSPRRRTQKTSAKQDISAPGDGEEEGERWTQDRSQRHQRGDEDRTVTKGNWGLRRELGEWKLRRAQASARRCALQCQILQRKHIEWRLKREYQI